MEIPYQTAKLKSANIMVILAPNNYYQYFQLHAWYQYDEVMLTSVDIIV